MKNQHKVNQLARWKHRHSVATQSGDQWLVKLLEQEYKDLNLKIVDGN